MSTLPDAGFTEQPIAWRLCWREAFGRPFDAEFPPAGRHRDFPTREQAETEKQAIAARLGAEAVPHIVPVHIGPTKRNRFYRKAQNDALTELGWPVQRRPSRSERQKQ